MADLNDEVNAVTANLSRLSAEFDRYSRLTSGAADSSKELTAVQRAQAAASRSASDSLYTLKKASGSLGSTLYEGRRGMQAFSTATAASAESVGSFMQMVAKAAGTLGNNALFKGFLEGIGKVAGGSVKIAATLYDLASNMADRQYDAYSKLTDTGAIASEGMTGVGNAAEKLGLNILKMDEYIGLVNENSKELASFGKSAFDGRRKFENLGQALEKDRQNFFALGMTQDQVNESMMGYIRLQNLAGRSQKMNSDELIAGTRKYLYEQDALAKLLGMSRKEQQSAREAALSEQRFGAKIAAMRASGDAQQIAAADELEKQNLVLAKVSPELAQGFRDLTTGMMTTEAAQKANMSTQGQVMKDIQDVSSGLKSGGEGAFSSLQALAKTGEKFNMAYQMGTGENFLVKFAETQQARQFLERDFNKEMKQILEERKTLVSEEGKPPAAGGDPRLLKYAALLKDQQQIMTALQSLVNKGITINLSDGSKIKLSADTATEIQQGITKEIIDYLQNNPYFKLDVRNTGKSDTDKIVSTDTDLKKAKLAAGAAKESRDQAKSAMDEEMKKVAALEKEVKAGKASQADLEAANKKLQEAANRAKAAEAALEVENKKLQEAEKRNKESWKNVKSAPEAPKPEADKKQANTPEAPKPEADKKQAAKSDAANPAKISLLPNGARVLEDVLELVNKGVPVISNVRTKEQQEALKHHQDDEGRWFTKDNLPVAEDTKHLTGDAIDVDTTKMTKELTKILQDSGWRRPLPKQDPGHWERVPAAKDKKTSEAVPPNDRRMNDIVSLSADQVAANAKNMPTVSDLTINSDVATLNSKGMNVTLDNQSDVARMLSETVSTKTDVDKKDQSIARTSFENSLGDVKTALSNQKETNELLLAAVQELIRVQKTGVDWQQKTYQATA